MPEKTILHITRMNFWSDKAHVYTTTKTCEALAMQPGIRVILLSSDDSLRSKEARIKFLEKHNIQNIFEIVSLNSIGNKFKGKKLRLLNWMETASVNLSIFKYVILNRRDFDILYFRDTSLFLPILVSKFLLSKPIFMEIHAVIHKKYKQRLNDYISKISEGLIAISYGLKEYYEKLNRNIIVSFCAAAEPERFIGMTKNKSELRKELSLPQDEIILMYSGNLYKTGNYDSYGIEDIISAMQKLDDNYIFLGIGKKGNETKEHEELADSLGIKDRIIFLPWMEKSELAKYKRASDVMLIPSAGGQIGNSPTKMFSYLVTERPIVAAKTGAIEEVLKDEENSLLVDDYKNPETWAKAIRRITSDKNLSERIVAGALSDSKKYTWNNRGRTIGEFIEKTLSNR